MDAHIFKIMKQFSNPMNVFAMAGAGDWRDLSIQLQELSDRGQVIKKMADAENRPLNSSKDSVKSI